LVKLGLKAKEGLISFTTKKEQLNEQELYDIVIVLIEYNKVNPRKRWSDLAEKIMTVLKMHVISDPSCGETLCFDHEDETREFI